MIGCNRRHLPLDPALIFAPTRRSSRNLLQRFAVAAAAALAAGAGMQVPASAQPIDFTVDFDLVNVSAANGPNGSLLLYATGIGSGPFEAVNGTGPVLFDSIDSQGNETNLNGITTGQIVANYLQPRYFGSDASSNGSIIENLTNFKFIGGANYIQVPGATIGGFQVSVAQPATDSIVSADGGNAFTSTSISSNGKTVTFSGGNIANLFYPLPGDTGDFLWSAITPQAPQPPSSDVYYTSPTIPPDPNGEFANMRLVGQAIATPEPPGALVLLVGLSGLSLVLSRRPALARGDRGSSTVAARCSASLQQRSGSDAEPCSCRTGSAQTYGERIDAPLIDRLC
jgi:hypothetical protein